MKKPTPPPIPEGRGLSGKLKSGGVIDCKKLSESNGRMCVSVRHRRSRSYEATMSARRGPLFLTDLAFKTPSVNGPGLRDTSPPSNSNNMSPLPLTMVGNFRQEHKYDKFFATRVKGGHDV